MVISFGGYLTRMAVAFFLVLTLAWIYVASFPMAFLPGGYPAWAAKSAMLAQCQLGKLSFFGDSRLESGVVPALLPVDAVNFGLAAGTTLEVHSAVGRALACDTPPAQVVISLVPDHFGPLDRFFWLNALLYGFISPTELHAIERLADELEDRDIFAAAHTPDGLGGRLRNWIYASGLPSLHFSSLVKGRLFGRTTANQMRYDDVLRTRGFSEYPAGTAPPPADEGKPFAAARVQAAIFDRTLAMLQSRGIDVVLMAMPVSTQAASDTTAGYLAFMQAAAARHPNTSLLTPEVPRWPAALFADGAHLSGPGARLFSRKLADCITGERLQAKCDLSLPAADIRAER